MLALTGHTATEFYANPDLLTDCIHPDDLHLLAPNHRGAAGDLAESVLLRWIHPDGRIVWADHRRVLSLDADQRLIAVEGIARDVTESVALQDRLRESERVLRRLTEHLNTVREEERAHLARELHDELGQTLTSIKLELAHTFDKLVKPHLDPESIDRVQSIMGNIDLATERVRRLATSLRPPALDHLGLVAAVELEAAAFSRRTGLRCRVLEAAPVTRLSATQATALFRILQEALINVARHAKASAIRISIREHLAAITVTIHDNGRGIRHKELADPAALGLMGMRERAAQIGASFVIKSARANGTTVVVSLPTPHEERRAMVTGA